MGPRRTLAWGDPSVAFGHNYGCDRSVDRAQTGVSKKDRLSLRKGRKATKRNRDEERANPQSRAPPVKRQRPAARAGAAPSAPSAPSAPPATARKRPRSSDAASAPAVSATKTPAASKRKKAKAADPPTQAATTARTARAKERSQLATDIDALKCASGQIRSFAENKMILTYALQYRSDLLERGETITDTALAAHTAHMLHVAAFGNHTAVYEMLKVWKTERAVIVGERNPNPPILSARKLKPEHLVAIEKHISECHASRGKAVTIPSIQKFLKAGGDDLPGVDVRLPRACRVSTCCVACPRASRAVDSRTRAAGEARRRAARADAVLGI